MMLGIVSKRPYSFLAQTLEEMATMGNITKYFMTLRSCGTKYYGEFWWYPDLLGNFDPNRTIIWIADSDLADEDSLQLWLDGIVEHFQKNYQKIQRHLVWRVQLS